MKINAIISMVAIYLTIFTTNAISQCNCQVLTKNDIGAKQCPTKQIAGDNSMQVGIAVGKITNSDNQYLSLSIRFRYSAQKVLGNLYLSLANGRLIELEFLNSGLAYMGNSEICQSTFILDDANKALLKMSPIKTIAFYLEDKLRHLLILTSNRNLVQLQIDCL